MLRQYLSLAAFMLLFLMGCAKKDEKSMIDAAKQKLQNRDISGALADYEAYLKEFPKGENVPAVLMDMGGIFQSLLDTRVTGEASIRKAVGFYTQVIEKHAQAKEAAKAQFLIAYLQANELKEFDAARASYQKFIDTYPNDPLVQSAKDEIQNIGISPEEIIRRKTASAQK